MLLYTDANLESTAIIVITAPYEIQGQLASALSWLCATVRHSPHELPSLSRTNVSAVKSVTSRGIVLHLGPITPITETKTCWHALFTHTAIAADFPPRGREGGRGLEISFFDMISLAKSFAFVEVNGGLVLDGLVTVLYPVKKLKDGAIQWHLVLKYPKGVLEEDDGIGIHPLPLDSKAGTENWSQIIWEVHGYFLIGLKKPRLYFAPTVHLQRTLSILAPTIWSQLET